MDSGARNLAAKQYRCSLARSNTGIKGLDNLCSIPLSTTDSTLHVTLPLASHLGACKVQVAGAFTYRARIEGIEDTGGEGCARAALAGPLIVRPLVCGYMDELAFQVCDAEKLSKLL